MQKVLNIITRENISPSKSTIVALTKRTKLEGLGSIKFRGKEI